MSNSIHTTPKEWYLCMDAGLAAVRRPYELSRSKQLGNPIISIYHIPSFFDCTGWVVYKSFREKSYTLQSLTWKQSTDSRRATISPEPTLVEMTATLDAAWFQHRLTVLSAIHIPIHIADEWITIADGESYGIHTHYTGRSKFAFEWQTDGPAEWATLVDWTQKCIDQFRELHAARLSVQPLEAAK